MSAIVPADEPNFPAPTMLETVMRAVTDPQMDPARLEHFLKIGRELQQDQARAQFNADFAALKLELPVINKNGVVLNKAGKKQFNYARYDDIHEAITPLLARHGFATSFDFDEPEKGRLTVKLKLLHVGGHSEEYHWTLPASGDNQYVTNLQNAAAARSFGKRCVIIDALDILTRDQDSDGRPAAPAQKISEDQLIRINDIAQTCTDKEPQFARLFDKWLLTEFQCGKRGDLYQGAQYDQVMEKLAEKQRNLGLL